MTNKTDEMVSQESLRDHTGSGRGSEVQADTPGVKRKRGGFFYDHIATIKNLVTAFTVVMGVTLVALGGVLCAGPNPSFLPFEIVPVDWGKPASTAAQLSIFFTFLSFITSNVLLLRIALCLSFGIGIVAFGISTAPLNLSFVLWYFAIFLINMRHVVILLYDRRHLEFDPDREKAYVEVFEKLLTRNSFEALASTALIRVVNPGRDYIKVGDSCENLTLLLSGTIKKIDTMGKVSFVNGGEFVDSPEWIMQTEASGRRFNISFNAETECRLLLWPREMLNDLLLVHPELEGPLLASLGIDVSKKVFLLDVVKSAVSSKESASFGEPDGFIAASEGGTKPVGQGGVEPLLS